MLLLVDTLAEEGGGSKDWRIDGPVSIPGVKAGRAAVVKGTLALLTGVVDEGGHRLPALGVAVPSGADAVPSHKPMSRFLLSFTAKRLICWPFTSVRTGADGTGHTFEVSAVEVDMSRGGVMSVRLFALMRGFG